MQHQVGQAQRERAVQRPGEALEPLRPGRRVAEAAGLLDRLRRRVVLAGEAEHGAGHVEAGGQGGLGHGVALVPGGVVRVAAGDLHDVDAEPVEQAASARGRS